jgi:hypothetical protein
MKFRPNVVCHKCEQRGHYANRCPNKKVYTEVAAVEDDMARTLHLSWEASNYCTRTVNSAVDESLKVGPNEVLLDNQTDISIIRPHLLVGVKQSDREISINGVGGLTLKVNQTGHLPDFFKVYASEDTLANVLCFSDVEDKYKITYIPQESFIVHLEDRDIEFKRRGKLYVAQWDEVANLMSTVKESEAMYTKSEIERAKIAHGLIRNSGYPSMGELVKIIEDGNIVNMPGITRADIQRAYGNATSTWVMWCITTKDYVRRSVWTKMVTNDMVIRTMNNYAEDANEAEEAVDEEPDNVPGLADALDGVSDDEDDDDDDTESRPTQSTTVAVEDELEQGLTMTTKVQES